MIMGANDNRLQATFNPLGIPAFAMLHIASNAPEHER
jgi:hypothetical protein